MDAPLKSDTSVDPELQAALKNPRKTSRIGLLTLSVGILATALVAIAVVVALSFASASPSEEKIRTKRGTESPTCAQLKKSSEYDYIIVGSGPGGSTLATRLALHGDRVLLIEAGPDFNDRYVNTPAFWALTQLNPNITANFKTYLFSKRQGSTIQYPRCMGLGGSTVMNVLVGMTPARYDWQYIERATEDPDWSPNNMIQKYQRLVENCEYCSGDARKQGYYNITLPIKELITPRLNETSQPYADFLDNIRDHFVYNPDVNKDSTYDSWFYLPVSADKQTGIRSSSYRRIKAVQALVPDNLHVWTDTFVTKLIIDPKTKDACGVEYVQGSNLYKALVNAPADGSPENMEKFNIYAKREIIVSGGQWMSPQLLQLSGIGDKDLLKRYGIKTIKHLPGVGNNLQDRNEMSYIVKMKNTSNILGKFITNCTFGAGPVDPCYDEYLKHPRTSYYSSNLVLAAALHSVEPIVPGRPDSAYLFAPLRFTGFRENWVLEALSYGVGTYLTVNINTARLLNKLGTVQIQSANPFDIPLIQTRHLTGPTRRIETNIIVQHLRYLRNLLARGEFAEKHVDYEELPGRRVKNHRQYVKFIRRYIWGHHSSCTNKMGNTETDPLAVVNSKAQVKGIKNLRVCDISIFPQIPGYYPVVPILILAEKIAHDIIEFAESNK